MSDDLTPDPENRDPRESGSTAELAGLERLVPEVDEEAAAATFARMRGRRTRQRRGLQAVGAAAAVVVVGLLAASLVGDGRGADDLVVAGPDPADTTDPSDLPPSPTGDPEDDELAEVSTTGHGLEMTLSAPATARVGEVLEVTVTIRNVSGDAVGLGNGSACDDGAGVVLRTVGSTAPAGEALFGQGWDGELDSLTSSLADQMEHRTLAGRTPDDIWTRFGGCTHQLVPPEVIEPGNAVEVNLVVPVRWGIEPVPAEMELVATSSNIGPAAEGAIGELPSGPQINASLMVAIADDPDRAGSVDEILSPEVLPSAPGLADWIELSTPNDSWNIAPGATLEQTWQTELHWWNGLWVLWIDPDYLDGNVTGPLRIQYDPDRGEVVDVRSVAAGNGGSADDPGAPADYPPDTIIYQAD